MKYHIKRDGQEYGPYTLADLQRYVAQGNIQLTDLARSEGLEEWVPVERVIGNVAAGPPPPSANYGQVPVYAPGAGGIDAQTGVPSGSGPLPPGLHWAVVFVLSLVTCGIFSIVWMFVQAVFVRKLQGSGKGILLYSLGISSLFLGQFLQATELVGLGSILGLGGGVLLILGYFHIKGALEEHYTTVEPLNLRLSGVMTFFFNIFYFQYHLTRIRNWKLTGVLL